MNRRGNMKRISIKALGAAEAQIRHEFDKSPQSMFTRKERAVAALAAAATALQPKRRSDLARRLNPSPGGRQEEVFIFPEISLLFPGFELN